MYINISNQMSLVRLKDILDFIFSYYILYYTYHYTFNILNLSNQGFLVGNYTRYESDQDLRMGETISEFFLTCSTALSYMML